MKPTESFKTYDSTEIEKKWIEKKSGSIIYNPSYKPHGMKVGKIPLVSIWCWPHNLDQKCKVIN